jgi:hypothetical protein
LSRRALGTAGAVTVVMDESTPTATVERIASMGKGWALGVRVWRQTGLRYLILCAATRERIRKGAPLVLVAGNVEEVAGAACAELNNVQCAWMFACSPETRSAMESVLLADLTPGGHA